MIGMAEREMSDGDKGSGAQGRIRTTDTRIFSPLLYQLSYLGTGLYRSRKGREKTQRYRRLGGGCPAAAEANDAYS